MHAGSDFGHKVSQDIYNNTTPVARLSQSAGRPVPNPSAFESGVDELMASHASEKSDATPNKKVCPPTPQRTPTWMAQSHNSYRRDEDDDELLQGDSMDGMDGMARAHFRRGPDVDDDPLCLSGKYFKRVVIFVREIFIGFFLFYCLLFNHSFPTNPNSDTNCFKTFFLSFFSNLF